LDLTRLGCAFPTISKLFARSDTTSTPIPSQCPVLRSSVWV
jgi:hypothetical protein